MKSLSFGLTKSGGSKRYAVGIHWIALGLAGLSLLLGVLTASVAWLLVGLPMACLLFSLEHFLWIQAITQAEATMASHLVSLQILRTHENQRTRAETELNSELNGAIYNLSSTVTEQTMAAAQQVMAVVQLGSLMAELTQSAIQITARSRTLEEAAKNVLTSTHQVAATAQEVAQARDRGQQAVTDTIASNHKVIEGYRQLSQTFSTLSDNSQHIRQVLSLIEAISYDIHLLSLNASIEAAGAGEYGERFGVVAHEVKLLADKTHRAVSEIRQVVGGVDQSLNLAGSLVTHGEQAAKIALEVAQESGSVIHQFETMVEQAVCEATGIARLAEAMERQATEISFAIRLQQSSNQQALEALSTVQRVAQDTAIVGEQISSSVVRLENLSTHLVVGSSSLNWPW